MSSALYSRQVCIVGGGPAGLATAIALRQEGLTATVVDGAVPPIDKACGEGLMPDTVAALQQLGVAIPDGAGYPLKGIAFVDGKKRLLGSFARGTAKGLRRTVLHRLLLRRAVEVGVNFFWGARGVCLKGNQVSVNGQLLPATTVIGADGQNSRVRRDAGLTTIRYEQRRYGFRRHYRIAPWAEFVELYWGERCQIYVTPVAKDEVGVALISGDSRLRLDMALQEFPDLQRRLAGADASSPEKGSVTGSRVLRQVCRAGVALVGDASGSVDAITGEGMSLSFQQAIALARACKTGDIVSYELAHRELRQRPHAMAMLMLLLARHGGLRRRAFASLSQRPEMFDRLLAVHIGEASFRELLSWSLVPLGARFLTA